MSLADDLINEILAVTKPTKEAIDEARARRDLVMAAASQFDGVLRFIKSGSLAHHTVEGRVSDADASLVLDRRVYTQYGPDSDDGLGPEELVVGVAEVIRDTVKQVYPNARISTSHKRAIYLIFGEPLADGQDPTVDLVIGLNRRDAAGIWIPDLDNGSWDPSDPARHTELMRNRRRNTTHTSSKVVRLLKLYSKQWDTELLFSFHWTALMLESYPKRTTILQGVIDVLNHTADSLEEGDTDDPAGVSGPIMLPSGRERSLVISKVRSAAQRLERASEVEGDDETALTEVTTVLEGVFTKGLAADALSEAAHNLRVKVLDRSIGSSSAVYEASPVVTETLNNRPVMNTRAFAADSSAAIVAPHMADIESQVTWFEAGLSKTKHIVLHRDINDRSIKYVVSVPLLDRSDTQLLTVEVFGKRTRVTAHGLTGLRHVNTDGTLCLWFPNDPPSRQWTFDKGLVALLDLVALHLYKEERFKVTKRWLGEEVHND